ncbi:tRNA dimethylallyltransferase [Acanthamoeba castellanii str. Neff]|uniref:tRNA dimethylallyltransferase n=1 Tax=Acanthamoeba castellanii (strain ATCC 30010 / Neff) TaxID=1257118 RepID=L8HE46_ACACF|nr:tRNA dimethylallyltransferase [Acanthamoeba castellanii str. Neff]ELR23502.1 tRNA dimethylallyltransferase [Acanthamoeba castellanii str. Neff]
MEGADGCEEEGRSPVQKKQVVVVMGSTGVGKSQLAIDLALALQKQQRGVAEIINADSMQAGVVHHLLDVVEPTDINFNVIEFCRLALATIDDIHSRGNLPIVVGGTHYYLEALLWENVLLHAADAPLAPKHHHHQSQRPRPDEEAGEEGEGEHKAGGGGGTEPAELAALYRRLSEVDPLMASWLHPHNERKIKRALEVYDTTGQPYSDKLRQQASPTPRYDALLFWIDCDRAVLNARLDGRVDKMVRAGLLAEVADLRRLLERDGLPMDYTKGILQAIGYKEFAPYFAAAEKGGAEAEGALRACVAALKQRTRKYAKVQTSWVHRHFRPRATIHRLDSTRFEQQRWDDEVRLPAVRVLTQWYTAGAGDSAVQYVEVLRPPSAERASLKRPTSDRGGDDGAEGGGDSGEATKRNKAEGGKGESGEGREEALGARWRRFVCEECEGKVLQGEVQWRAHLASRGHYHHRRRRRQQALLVGITTAASTAATATDGADPTDTSHKAQ